MDLVQTASAHTLDGIPRKDRVMALAIRRPVAGIPVPLRANATLVRVMEQIELQVAIGAIPEAMAPGRLK